MKVSTYRKPRATGLLRALLMGVAVASGGCQSVRLGQPQALWALWLVPLWLWWGAMMRRRRARDLARLIEPACQAAVVRAPTPTAATVAACLEALAVLLMVVAAAQPRWGMVWEDVHRQGVDVVVALDVSESMRVQDVETSGRLSRLARAKREVTDLLRLMDGDRVGLVAFAGTAQVMCPLTLDHGAAQLFLDDIDTDSVAVKGTALADAIDVALQALGGEGPPGRSIILITDGESHVGNALQSAAAAAAAGVRIFAIGIGRSEGAPIPADDGGFHRDREGNLVMSRLDADILQQIAATTGGRYVRSQTGEIDLEAIYRHGVLKGVPLQDFQGRRQERWTERFQIFVGLAFALWLAESLATQRAGGRGPRRRGGAAALAACLCGGMLLTSPAEAAGDGQKTTAAPAAAAEVAARPGHADEAAHASGDPAEAYSRGQWQEALEGFAQLQASDPHNPALSLAIGSTAYQLGDYPRARAALAQAAQAPAGPIRTKALYALGNTAYRERRFKEAIAFYGQALAENPEHHGARHNTDLSHIALEQEKAEKAKKPDGKPGESRDDKEKSEAKNEQGDDVSDHGDDASQHGDDASDHGDDASQHGSDAEPGADKNGSLAEEKAPDSPPSPQPAPGDEAPPEADKGAQAPAAVGGSEPPDREAGDAPPAGKAPHAAHPGDGPKDGMSPEEAMRALEQVDEQRPHPSQPRGAPRVRGGKDW